jgi:hypothetical protein
VRQELVDGDVGSQHAIVQVHAALFQQPQHQRSRKGLGYRGDPERGIGGHAIAALERHAKALDADDAVEMELVGRSVDR